MSEKLCYQLISNNLREDRCGLAIVSTRVCGHHVLEHELNIDLSLLLVLYKTPLGILLSDSFLEEGFDAPTLFLQVINY